MLNMTMHNFMTCEGFDTSFFGGCSMVYVGAFILFWIIAILRKWGGEEIDVDFNFWASMGIGYLAYFIVVAITGEYKWALLAGIIGAIAGGYFGGAIFGGSEE